MDGIGYKRLGISQKAVARGYPISQPFGVYLGASVPANTPFADSDTDGASETNLTSLAQYESRRRDHYRDRDRTQTSYSNAPSRNLRLPDDGHDTLNTRFRQQWIGK